MENLNIMAIRQNLENALSRSFDTSRGIAVYGAGETAGRYSEIFTANTQNTDIGFDPIEPICFIDDTPDKQGTTFLGNQLSKMEISKGECVPVYALDEYFADHPISFLKADIEGYEWNMLSGGEKVIKRDTPKMAICLYHTPADMFRLMIRIKEICPDYKFMIRHQQAVWFDTILFAYVEKEHWISE